MQVEINDKQTALKLNHAAVVHAANAVISLENVSFDEVGIHFVDLTEISSLHDQFFNDPTPTDCISLPVDNSFEFEGPKAMGDLFVCPEVAIEYANKHDEDPFEETLLYVVHGLLHLIGYDDIDEEDRKLMRAAENRHLANLKIQGITLRL